MRKASSSHLARISNCLQTILELEHHSDHELARSLTDSPLKVCRKAARKLRAAACLVPSRLQRKLRGMLEQWDSWRFGFPTRAVSSWR